VSVVTNHQAKSNLSRLIKKVANGDEVIIQGRWSTILTMSSSKKALSNFRFSLARQ
jgi:hypothetical protein